MDVDEGQRQQAANSLSVGTIVLISLACIFVALLLFVLALWVLWRLKQSRLRSIQRRRRSPESIKLQTLGTHYKIASIQSMHYEMDTPDRKLSLASSDRKCSEASREYREPLLSIGEVSEEIGVHSAVIIRHLESTVEDTEESSSDRSSNVIVEDKRVITAPLAMEDSPSGSLLTVHPIGGESLVETNSQGEKDWKHHNSSNGDKQDLPQAANIATGNDLITTTLEAGILTPKTTVSVSSPQRQQLFGEGSSSNYKMDEKKHSLFELRCSLVLDYEDEFSVGDFGGDDEEDEEEEKQTIYVTG